MKKLTAKFRKCIDDFNMIENGDKIAVGLSGGKDSLTLLSLLAKFQKYSKEKYSLCAIVIDIFDGKHDFSPLQNFCDELNVPLYIEKTKINEIVFQTRKEQNPCSLCANMRRGILNTKASELGFNKVALGHHADDLMETFFLSMCYEGRLSTFAPKLFLTRSKITVIRPLLYCFEKEVVDYSKDFPIQNNCCEANHKTKREYMKNMLKDLEKDIPIAKERIFTALSHPERYNLLDKSYRER